MMQPYREKTFEQLKRLLDANHTEEALTKADESDVKCTIEVIWADFQAGYITVFGRAKEHLKTRSFWVMQMLLWPRAIAQRVTETFTVSPESKIVDEESY